MLQAGLQAAVEPLPTPQRMLPGLYAQCVERFCYDRKDISTNFKNLNDRRRGRTLFLTNFLLQEMTAHTFKLLVYLANTTSASDQPQNISLLVITV